jgi:ankyrin repeat protein
MGYASCGIMRGILETELLDTCRHDSANAITLVENTSTTMRLLKMDRHILEWVNCRDIDMRTPLHIASVLDRHGLISTLLREGANPNVVDNFGFTPLMRLCSSDRPHLDTIKLFIMNGCDIHYTNSQGQSCLFYAALHEHYHISLFLLLLGARIRDNSIHHAIVARLSQGKNTLSYLKRHGFVVDDSPDSLYHKNDPLIELIQSYHVFVSLRRIARAHISILNHEK